MPDGTSMTEPWFSTALRAAEAVAQAPLDALDAAIEAALGEVGRLVGADRAYRFEFDHADGVLWNSHEWCAPGVAPQIDMLQRAPIGDYAGMVEPLLEGRSFVVPDVERMDPAHAVEQAVLAAQGIRSVIFVPSGTPTHQFVGFDAVEARTDWGEPHERLLQVLGTAILARTVDRDRLRRAERERGDMRMILEALPDAGYLIDLREGRLRFASQQYEALYGRPLAGLYADSMDWIHAVHPEDRARLLDDTDRRHDEPVENQYRVVLPDGTLRRVWHCSVPVRDDLGHASLVAGIVRDITHFVPDDAANAAIDAAHELRGTVGRLLAQNSELRAVKRALESTATLFQSLAERTEAAVLMVREGRVTYANRTALRLTGRAAEEVADATLGDLFGAREAVRITRTVHLGFRGELSLRRPDGRAATLDASVQPLSYDGEPAVLIVGVDVSERVSEERRVASELEEMSRLARGNLVAQLYAGLAHELNQPLTSIIAYGFGAARKLRAAGVNEEMIEIVDRMSSEAERAGEIVRQLRALFERRETENRALCARELIERTAGLMSLDFERHGIDLRLRLSAAGQVRLTGDAAQLEVILLNLMRNAAEALEPAPAPRWIRVSARAEGADVVIEVADPGRPIPPEAKRRLFESFFTTRSGGTGTGLYLSRRIAESHGGQLEYVDEPPLKIFRLRLPRAPAVEVA
jgi:two-component system sensor kinase FixL